MSLKIICEDPWAKNLVGFNVNFPTLQPGAKAQSNTTSGIYYDSTFPGYFNLKFEISSGGYLYWEDSLRFTPKITEVEKNDLLPIEYFLEQNYPNPFNPITTIGYGTKEKSNVKIIILNIIGEEVAVLVNEEQDKGYNKVEFDGSKLSSGVYFYKLVAKDFVSTKKIMLVK